MTRFSHNHRNDYDKQIQYGTKQIGCYSESAMKKQYPEKNYRIVGEIKLSQEKVKDLQKEAKKQQKQNARKLGELHMGEHVFDVFHSAKVDVFNKTQGYLCVGNDAYVLVKQTVAPFLILSSSMCMGLAICIILILLMLRGWEKEPQEEGVDHPLPPVDVNVETYDETGMGGEDPTETESETENGPGIGGHPSDSETEVEPDTGDGPIQIDPIETEPRETAPDTKESETTESETEKPSGGGSVSLSYTTTARYTYGESKVSIYFMNPSRSDHDVVLELYAIGTENQRVLMAKSGRIPAGTGLEVMTLMDGTPDLTPGSYRGLYRVLFYDPKTGERAMITTEIPDIVIKVEE